MSKHDFYVECMGHDIRSTQFAKGGCCDTLMSNDYKDPTLIAYAIENHPNDSRAKIDPNGIVQTLSSRMGTGGNNTPFVLIDPATEREHQMSDYKTYYWNGTETANTLTARNAGGGQRMPDKDNFQSVIEQNQRKYVLRRLTPTECLRLQGLPDNWCDDVNGSDSAIYKMAGNGLAIPCACDILGRIAEEMRKDATIH